jgi:flotillin
MSTLTIVGIVAGAIILLTVILLAMYVKAPPSFAYILSGLRKEPRVLIGTGGFKVPVIERLDKTFLGQISVDVKTSKPVPTHNFIDVEVDAVCKVRALPTPEGIRLAAKNFLNMTPEQIANSVKDSLEGNMREVIGAINLEELVTDRDTFSDQIQKKAATDMAKLGLEILSCNIQNITDRDGLIQGLGADNTFKIKKEAAITKANAQRDIEIAQSKAQKESNDVRVQTETEIAERNNELAIKKADLKRVSDTKQAEADVAYDLQKQEQLKSLNIKTVDAEIERTKRAQVLAEEEVKVTQNKLKATINAQADAEKYRTEINSEADKYRVQTEAQAELEQKKREAEAKAYMAEQEAKALKAKADAQKYAALQEAEGIRAKGEAEAAATQARLSAEAEGIRAKGDAEAEAMDKKSEAFKKSEFAKLEMVLEMQKAVLPQVAKSIADPMAQIGDVKIYGTTGQEIGGISNNVPTLMKKAFDLVGDVSGVDPAEIIKAGTISAKTDRNINIEGLPENMVPTPGNM